MALLSAALLALPLVPSAETIARCSLGADLLWSDIFGGDYANAPSAPLVSGDYVYVFVRKTLLKLDRFTGEILLSSDESSRTAGYGIISPTMGGGMIFMPLNGGAVAAFDSETLELLWETEAFGGQSMSPVVYADGKIFSGTWVAENRDGCFYACSAEKSGCKTLWRLEHKGGFYRVGALYEDGKLIFGSDDGELDGINGSSTLFTVDAETGEIYSETDGIEGDIRSGIVRFEDGYVFSSKAGYLYKVTDEGVSRADIGAACASSPAVSDGIAYVGTADSAITAVRLSNMEVVRKISAPAYPNGGITLRGNRIYATCNAEPGGVYTCTVSDSEMTALFEPTGDAAQYCISPVSFSDDGTLYYKNDSGYLFALSIYAQVRFDTESDEIFWLITPDSEPILSQIYLPKGEALKINGGSRVMLWRKWLEPLSEVICL